MNPICDVVNSAVEEIAVTVKMSYLPEELDKTLMAPGPNLNDECQVGAMLPTDEKNTMMYVPPATTFVGWFIVNAVFGVM